MSKQEPTVWQQCKAISEALAPRPRPEDPQETVRRLRAALLAQLAAGSEKGAKLAARLANADGPIQVAPEEWPDELWDSLQRSAQRR
jgi:hypothetical protein